MTLNPVLYMQVCIFCTLRLIHYDHDDTAQAASTIMDILISKKEVIGVCFFFLSIIFHLEGTFSITERQNISESKSAPPPFTALRPRPISLIECLASPRFSLLGFVISVLQSPRHTKTYRPTACHRLTLPLSSIIIP
jgi:hypothetical protein